MKSSQNTRSESYSTGRQWLKASEQVSMLKMTPSKLATLPSLGERDIFRSFQLMPGISAANEHNSGLYVRGGTPDQALTLYDGFTVYNVDHLYGFFSAFNSNSIKDVQLYKGVFDAKYGGRLSSVVEITGKDGNNRRFNAGGDLSLLSANIWLEKPFSEKFTTIITARRSWKGPLYQKIFDRFSGEEDDTQNTPFGGQFGNAQVSSYFYDINAKATWKPNEKDVFSLSFYNGADKLDNSITPQLPSGFGGGGGRLRLGITDLTNWGNTGASLKWSRKWNERLYANTLVSYSNYFSNRDRSVSCAFERDGESQDIKRGTFENNNLKDFSAKTDWAWKFLPVTFTIEGDPTGQQVAPLLLLPFVENAFKFGSSTRDLSPIQIAVVVSEKQLTLSCQNHIRSTQATSSGIGIANTRRRLELLYNGRYSLRISEQKGIYTVLLNIEL